MLKQVHIAGWKSIKDQRLELRSLNVMIGANGAGKSNLISFFRLLRAIAENSVQALIARAGGASAVLHRGPKATTAVAGATEFISERGLERHEFRLEFAGGDRLISDCESFSGPKPDSPGNQVHHMASGGQFARPAREGDGQDMEPVPRIRELLGGIGVYHVHDTSDTAPMRLAGYIEDNRGLRSDAGNLAAVLHILRQRQPESYRRVVGAVRTILPDFDEFELERRPSAPQSILLNWRQRESDYLFGPHQFSDGSLRFIALATLLSQPTEIMPSVLIIDEPELGLHPAALTLLAGMLRSASKVGQVIVATQSVALLDEFEVDEVVVAEMAHGESRFRRLDPRGLSDWLEEYSLSQLWEKNVFGGGPFG